MSSRLLDSFDGQRPLTVAELLERLTPNAFVTPAIVFLLALTFVLSLVRGADVLRPSAQALLDAGGDYGPALLAGEWWRLGSATLLHAGLLHLAFNVWALWNAGLFAERIFGNAAYLVLYVASGLGASLLSVAVRPLVVSVGASGAIFGVYGALLAFVLTHHGVFTKDFLAAQRNSLFAFVAYNLLFGLTQPNIDLWGHAGGFATGFLAGLALSRDLLAPKAHRVRRVLAAVALALALGVAALLVRVRLAVLEADDVSLASAAPSSAWARAASPAPPSARPASRPSR